LDILNGIRVFSIAWVILGHTYFYTLSGPIQNVPGWPLQLFDTFSFALVLSAPFSVDIFFWLSGFLGTYILLTGMKKKKGRMIPFWMTVLH
jgi:peptidoglycan/LPS O-acetylase OafA/YrhL